MRIVFYLIGYLGEFEFIFETILDYESGDQMGSFDAKKPPSKFSCLATFKAVQNVHVLQRQQQNPCIITTLAQVCTPLENIRCKNIQ
jgi:hypothetical protein